MQLRVSVNFADKNNPVDVTVQVGGSALVKDVAAGLVEQVGSTVDPSLVAISGRGALSPEICVNEAQIRDGDQLTIGLPTPAQSPTAMMGSKWRVQVEAGPGSGSTFDLGDGTYTLGRRSSCDIVLDDTVDPTVSGVHARLELTSRGGTCSIRVADEGSTNGTFVNGQRLTEESLFREPVVVQLGAVVLSVEPLTPSPSVGRLTDGKVEFNRPMRSRPVSPNGSVALPDVPKNQPRHPLHWITMIAPMGMGLVMFAVTGQAWFLLLMIGTPLMLGGQQLWERRRQRKAGEGKRESFDRRLEQADQQLRARNVQAARDTRRTVPSTAEWVARATGRTATVWERRPTDDDFLQVRLGLHTGPALIPAHSASRVTVDDDVKDADVAKVDAVQARHAQYPHLPVTIQLPESAVVGIAGKQASGLARSLLMQAVVGHSPRDLAVVVITGPESSGEWEWAKWLPHTHTLTADDLTSTVTTGEREAAAMFEVVDNLVTTRARAAQRTVATRGHTLPHVLVVAAPDAVISAAAFDSVMSEGADLGVSALVWSDQSHLLPSSCRATIEVADEHTGSWDAIISRIDGTHTQVNTEPITAGLAEQVARQLAPLVDVTATGTGAEIPTQVSLLAELGLSEADPNLVTRQWAAAGRGRSAPIGPTAAGSIELDLRTDGPHALVAGTTGAGKSEFLQSYIASLAARYCPADVNFVLVDYKGGAAFRECVGLPHTVGFITDLDDHLTTRALTSLNAELVRREKILNQYQAKDLLALERNHPDAAPPALVIVIDEFAALARECEAFVDGVVDIAQRGRSLGVHLILATQKPGGVINSNIQANTDIRVCLRVANEDEARDVIDTTDAAHLPKNTPGRGYVRLGATPATQFHSAYAGTPHTSDRNADHEPADVSWIHPYTPGLTPPALPTTTTTHTGPTELDVLVELCQQAHHTSGQPDPHRPWLDPLPELLTHDQLHQSHQEATDPHGLTVTLGLADYPHQQTQIPYQLDLADVGNLAVYGTARTGKTTLLRTLAADIATHYSPDHVHIYALDYASRGLTPLTALPNTAAVLTPDQTDHIDRLFTLIDTWINERKTQLGNTHTGNYNELCQHLGPNTPARKLILIDGFANFHSTFEYADQGRFLPRFARWLADGPSVGVHFVVTGENRRSLPVTYSSLMSAQLVFRQANSDDYYNLGLPSLAGSGPTPGRCWDTDHTEVHIGLLTADAQAGVQADALRDLGETVAQQTTSVAPALRTETAELTMDTIAEHPTNPVQHIRIGLSTSTEKPVYWDTARTSTMFIVGPKKTDKSGIAAQLASELLTANPHTHLLASAAIAIQMPAGRATSATDGASLREHLVSSSDNLDRLVIALDDVEELISESDHQQPLRTLLEEAAQAGTLSIFAAASSALRRPSSDWITQKLSNSDTILLSSDQHQMRMCGLDPTLAQSSTYLPPGTAWTTTSPWPAPVDLPAYGFRGDVERGVVDAAL